MGLLYQRGEGPATDTRSIAFPPAPEDRNLLNPYLPGTKSFTKRVNDIQFPNPLTTKPSENLMYDVGAVAPIAYHGTPHRFDKFDTSKIGTGQGAQSYGHGLYFAENPQVAGQYQIKGATIKADILPSADKFLDWDKPLSEQGKDVVANLKKAGIVDKDGYVGSINGAKHINDVTGDDLHQIIKEQYANNYGDKKLLSVKAKGPDEAVSKYLSELGIPGIRYLDQGSRSAGKGTYNYVVFNDKDVKILERK